MIHTYVFKENSSDRDFKIICKRIEKDCPGYALAERESFEEKIESVRWTNGKKTIWAELERDYGAVTVCSDEPLPSLSKLSKLWEKESYSIIRKLRLLKDILADSPAHVKFILLPLLLSSAAFLGGFAEGGDIYEDIITGVAGILAAVNDLLINWAFLGWVWLIPAGAALTALANRQEKPLENGSELSGGNIKGLLRKLRALINREADFLILLGLAALPAFGAGYASYRFSVYSRLGTFAEYTSHVPFYAPLSVFLCALPYLIIGELIFSGMAKRKKRPSAKAAALLGLCSVMAALTVTVKCSDLYTGFYNTAYNDNYALICNAEKMYTEARGELILTKYADELNDIAEYALARDCFDWTECPDESLEKHWEKIFLEGRADYKLKAEDDGIIFDILGTEHKITPKTEWRGSE